MAHPSIADIPEASLVEHLLSDPYWRSTVLGIRGIPDGALNFQRVPLADMPGGLVGDVDILLCPKDQPASATAIEVKRLKIGARAFHGGRPNKLREYEKGVRQANTLAQVGFSLVYLYVLVVVDSREQNAGRVSYDGPTPELRDVIDQTISLSGLDGRVGVVHYEFVQPMDHAPFRTGTHGGHLKRLAQPVAQPAVLTGWVARFMAAQAAQQRAPADGGSSG